MELTVTMGMDKIMTRLVQMVIAYLGGILNRAPLMRYEVHVMLWKVQGFCDVALSARKI